MKICKLLLMALMGSILLNACSSDVVEPTKYVPLGSYDSGVLVVNEGVAFQNDASLSYISFDLNTLQNDIFSVVNHPKILGDTAQCIGFYNQYAYIVMNISNTIEVVNRYTMVSIATITTGLNNPRYIVFSNGKGYVTNWGDGTVTSDDYVAVINLNSNAITSTIPVVEGPDKIIENAGTLYVAHSGGYHFGNTISVINTANNSVSSILVGDVPNAMQISGSSLWVTCAGKPSYAPVETSGKLVQIDLVNNQLVKAFDFGTVTKHPANLAIADSKLFYTINSEVYSMPMDTTGLPASPKFIAQIPTLYGFAIKNNHIYVSGYTNYDQNGTVTVYSLGNFGNSPIGTLQKTHTVGVGPSGFYFNQ